MTDIKTRGFLRVFMSLEFQGKQCIVGAPSDCQANNLECTLGNISYFVYLIFDIGSKNFKSPPQFSILNFPFSIFSKSGGGNLISGLVHPNPHLLGYSDNPLSCSTLKP